MEARIKFVVQPLTARPIRPKTIVPLRADTYTPAPPPVLTDLGKSDLQSLVFQTKSLLTASRPLSRWRVGEVFFRLYVRTDRGMLPLFQTVEGDRRRAKLMPEIVALNAGHKICQVIGKVQGEYLWITFVFFEASVGYFRYA